MRIYLGVSLGCVAAIIVAAARWLPIGIGVSVGAAGVVTLVLSTATIALRVAKAKNRIAGGFFGVGLFLLIVAYPTYRPIVSLFEPAQRGIYYELPGEAVFGFLAVVCIIRAWWLWTTNEKDA